LFTGCSFTDFVLDPIGSISDSSNTSSSSFNNRPNSNSNSIPSLPTVDTPKPIDRTPPSFREVKTISERIEIDYDNLDSYDFSPIAIGLTANDTVDGNLTSAITYSLIGLETNQNNRTFYYVNYSVKDSAGNQSSIKIPFRAYRTYTVDKTNFNEYFEIERNLFGGHISDGTTVSIAIYLRPSSSFEELKIDDSDLSVQFRLNLAWRQELRQEMSGYYLGKQISVNNYSKTIDLSRNLESGSIINDNTFKDEPFMSAYRLIENTNSWRERTSFNPKFTPAVYWNDINRSSTIEIRGSIRLKEYLTY